MKRKGMERNGKGMEKGIKGNGHKFGGLCRIRHSPATWQEKI